MRLFNYENFFNYETKIVGTVTPVRWDERGRPVRFSIYTPSEKDYIASGAKYHNKLKNLVNHQVEAIGNVHINEDGEEVIYIRRLRVLGSGNEGVIAPEIPNTGAYEDYVLTLPKMSRYDFNLLNEAI